MSDVEGGVSPEQYPCWPCPKVLTVLHSRTATWEEKKSFALVSGGMNEEKLSQRLYCSINSYDNINQSGMQVRPDQERTLVFIAVFNVSESKS